MDEEQLDDIQRFLLEMQLNLLQIKYNANHDHLGRFSSGSDAHLIVHQNGERELGPKHPDHPNNKQPKEPEFDSSHFDGISSIDEKEALLNEKQKEWQHWLTKGQKSSIKYYTGSGYQYMNDALRKGKYETMPYYDKEGIDAVSTALEKASLPENMTVVRGVLSDVLNKEYFEKRVGSLFEDKGFMSTTIKPSAAFNGIKMVIHVPKGYQAAYVKSLSNVPHEHEVLLQRGTQMKVLKVDDKGGGPAGDDPVVHMQVIPIEEKKSFRVDYIERKASAETSLMSDKFVWKTGDLTEIKGN